MPRPIGSRVGALVDEQDGVVRFLGYGTYDGDLVSPYGLLNPRIALDNGEFVWGLECWWGEEGRIERMMKGKQLIRTRPNRDKRGHLIEWVAET